MTTDERISKDLALVGRASRERPITLETTLRNVGALRITAAPAPSLAMLKLARVYMHRVARAWAGAVAGVATIALLAYVAIPRGSMADFGGNVWTDLFYGNAIPFIALVLLAALVAYAVAAGSALLRFERALEGGDPLATGRRLVEGIDGWSVAGAIGGAACFALFFGLMWVALGAWGMASIIQPYEDPLAASTVSAMLVLCATSMVAALAAAWLIARVRRGDPAVLVATGVAMGVATIIVGMRYDVGPMHVTLLANVRPSIMLRAALTVPGTFAVVLVAAGLVLRRRAREEEELGSVEFAAGAPKPSDEALLTP